MSVLKNLKSSFISHLVKTLEDKIYFSERRYSNLGVYFPPVVCENGRSPLLRFKSVLYYVISKLGQDEWGLDLVFRDRLYSEIIMEGNTFDDIARKYLKRVYKEGERFYFNIFFSCVEYYWEPELIDYWEDCTLYSHANDGDEDLRPRIEAGPFYYEDKYGGNFILESRNGISTFREEECIVCKNVIPNTLYCNCGHIVVCDRCWFVGELFNCPLCRVPGGHIRIIEPPMHKTAIDYKRKLNTSNNIIRKRRAIKPESFVHNMNYFCTLL